MVPYRFHDLQLLACWHNCQHEGRLLQRDRMHFDDGAILEMVIWRIPTPVKGSTHHYKYRLFFGHPARAGA
jgi:hypothetical protein